MNIHDGAALFERIVSEGLADKCLRDFSFGDLKLLADLISEQCDGTEIPHYDGNGVLMIPFDAPLQFRYWKQKLSDKEKYDLFLEMGVPAEDMHFFMCKASIDEALSKTNDS